MKKRSIVSLLTGGLKRSLQGSLRRNLKTAARKGLRAGLRAVGLAVQDRVAPAGRAKSRVVESKGDWIAGTVVGAAGARLFRLYRPPDLKPGEQLPLMVMLHGCKQDAKGFAASTRMNSIAMRERFLVLYPEQDRLANVHGCWNWFDTNSGRAYGEAALILQAVDQVCASHPIDRDRIAVAGLSAGASMAALLVTRYPERFKAVVMHSGVPPGAAHSTLSALGAMSGHGLAKLRASKPASPTAAWPPLLVIHGGVDRVVSARNARGAVQMWADAAGARAAKQRSVQRGERYAMKVTDFKHLRGVAATLVEVAALGHAWSGGASTLPFGDSQGPDASRMAWAFALKQFRA